VSLNYQSHAFPTVNAFHAFTECVDIATRRDNYNTLRSSPFRVAYPRYLLAFFASPLWNETAMHAHCPLVPFYLSLSFALCLFSRLFILRFSLFRRENSCSPPSCTTEAECVRHSNPLSFPPSLFRWFFFLSLASSVQIPPRLLLPALSHLLHCHPFPTFCSLTNRAAREYIFYRHSWWPPHICANLPAGLPLACLGQARPLQTRAIPDLPRLNLRCLSYSLQLQSHTIWMHRRNN